MTIYLYKGENIEASTPSEFRKMNEKRGIQLLVYLFAIHTCYAYQSYQFRIPNGEVVPHPCKASNLWKGVGHRNRLGGGERNPFGIDFKNNGAVWDATLCNLDSDNDGKTNGEELGDPNCEWRQGQGRDPERTTGLSHPGVCEPLGSDRCGPQPEWVSCEKEDFICDALNEPETFNYTVRFPTTPVPDVKTTYACIFFEFPPDQEYHLVANTPYIDNEAVVHHILVFGCTANITTSVSLNTVESCHMGSGHPNCMDVIAHWAVGFEGTCQHPKTGIIVGGGARGYNYAAIQIHWNNPELRSDYTDSSGINFMLTPKLRPYNAGVLVIGQNSLEIPPGELTTVFTGGCSGKCSRQIMTDSVNITAAGNHMHYLGQSQITELRRGGKTVATLSDDQTYNFDAPVLQIHKDAIVVQPGDELHTTCVFQSTSMSTTTYFGEETSDEMCFSLLTYYPKENVRARACINWRSIESCEVAAGVVQGCNLQRLRDPRNVDEMNVKEAVNEKCARTHCRKECKAFIKVLKSTDPCYKGDVYQMRLRNAFADFEEAYLPPEDAEYFTRVNSCDEELALERYIDSIGGEPTGVGSELAASLTMCTSIVLLKIIF